VTDLQEVEMTGAHSCHALADSGLNFGAGKFVALFEETPFGAAKNGAGWKVLLKLPLSE
jgi:hypothetical protein